MNNRSYGGITKQELKKTIYERDYSIIGMVKRAGEAKEETTFRRVRSKAEKSINVRAREEKYSLNC